uniref:Lipoprotein n=1 Tax=Roseihalotalea indica TaxID=2867963 RepID=A0AA49GME9_9BACT|nr:hypothetical protein K4G66_02275 [Tunicatimonas sp. TK19036]
MKYHLLFACLIALLAFTACSENDENEDIAPKADFYINFTLGDSSYSVTNNDCRLSIRNLRLACAGNFANGERSTEDYVYGVPSLLLENPEETNFINSFDFAVSKKVYTDELDTKDESSYIKKVLNADQFGFPINPGGFFTTYDLENDIYIVDRDVKAEAYFYLTTVDDEVYRSTSVVPNERSEESFFTIDAITETKDTTFSEYQYIIEGRFKVNMFKGFYGTDSEIMEGNFRCPISSIKNAELLNLCE